MVGLVGLFPAISMFVTETVSDVEDPDA